MRNKIMVTGGRRLVRRHLINLLRLLTRKWDRQRTAQCCLECSSPFPLIKLSTCSDWGTWCTCVYLVYDCAFWWEVTVVEAYQSALCWYKWFTPQVATYLQSLILNLVYRVACPLCHQVVDSTCQMCWLHPQNWLAVRFLISWLTSKFVEIAKPEMLWSGHVTNIDFTGIQICSNFLSSHERILEGSDPLHIS